MSRVMALMGWVVERFNRWRLHRQGLFTASELHEMLEGTVQLKARSMGSWRGEMAATWVFDGNTSQENYRMFLSLFDEGDPALDEVYGPPLWLSGEHADEMTPAELAHRLRIDEDDDRLDDLCTIYEEAADEAWYAELERVARYQTQEI